MKTTRRLPQRDRTRERHALCAKISRITTQPTTADRRLPRIFGKKHLGILTAKLVNPRDNQLMKTKTKSLDLILAFALVLVVISGFCYTWTPTSPVSVFGALSHSADGRIVCACPTTSGALTMSRDWGKTWYVVSNAAPRSYTAGIPVALNADGSQIIACLFSNTQIAVFLSNDSGTNWTKLGVPPLSLVSTYCVASSASGSNLVAAVSIGPAASGAGPLYYSINSGANWFVSNLPSTNWAAVATSADGREIVAAASGGNIYVSTNFGNNWLPISLPAQAWKSACVSADGAAIGATGANTYISQDSGVHWITNKTVGGSIACSADGATWMIAGAQVYTSSDRGVTWVTNSVTAGRTGAMSADGCEIVAGGTGGGSTDWVGRIVPKPQLNIQPANEFMLVSWLLPSTNFVLQQTADLSNPSWTTVSKTPTLNFTNLQQQVTMPTTGSSAFFRLIAQ